MTEYDDLEPAEPLGWSPLAVSMIATLVLLLGLAGSLFGIYVSNVNAQAAAAAAIPTPQREIVPTAPTTTTTTPPATTPATTTTTTTPPVTTPAGSFPLPKLSGQDFKDARTKVRDLKLGWVLKFEGANNDATVRDTTPTFGTLVQKGVTVTIFVKGAAPLAVVPTIAGKQCAVAADLIVDAGLYPDFKTTARTGTVLPGLPQAGLHWNDKMQLACSG